MTAQQPRLFPQVSRFSERQLRRALQIVQERGTELLLGESGLGPAAHEQFIAEVRAEAEGRNQTESTS